MKIWEPMPRTVWDKEGDKWEYTEDDEKWTYAGVDELSTWDLLRLLGPVTDTEPVKVGDEVTAEAFADMPAGSIAAAANSRPWIKASKDRFLRAGEEATYHAGGRRRGRPSGGSSCGRRWPHMKH